MKKINFVIFLAVCIIAPYFVNVIDVIDVQIADETYIVEIWQIDTFEAGKQSRLTMLNNMLSVYKSENENVCVYVRNIEYSTAIANMRAGQYPDMVMFGSGVDSEIINYLLTLNNEYGLSSNFVDSGRVAGELYAVPITLSANVLISKTEYDDTAENVIVRNIDNVYYGNDSIISASEHLTNLGVNQTDSYSPYDAYCQFIKDDDGLLAGTMRDVVRTVTRSNNLGESYYYQTIDYYNLADYVAICKYSDHIDLIYNIFDSLFDLSQTENIGNAGLFSTLNRNMYSVEPYNSIENDLYNITLKKLWS